MDIYRGFLIAKLYPVESNTVMNLSPIGWVYNLASDITFIFTKNDQKF